MLLNDRIVLGVALVMAFLNNCVISYPKTNYPLGFHVEDNEIDYENESQNRIFTTELMEANYSDYAAKSNRNYTKFLNANFHKDRNNITYDDLKRFFRTFLEDELQEISPSIIRMAREARGHKKKAKKFLIPMILGALLVKSLLLPIVLKGLAFLSSKAVIISIVSLIVASISGLKRAGRQDEKTEVQVIHVPAKHGGGYKRYDDDDHDEHYHEHEHEYGGYPYHNHRAIYSQSEYHSGPSQTLVEHYR